VLTFDLNRIQQSTASTSQSHSGLKMQTRCISCFPDRTGYVLGSVEGRCQVKSLEEASKTFSFKCHRTDNSIGAVNVVDFHPAEPNAFVTAGNDGTFVFWDKANKQCLKRFKSCLYPITAGRFNASGSFFAYAVSYDWSQGHQVDLASMPRQVLLHRCDASETKPKVN
ncbi:unnamed protein product, partial [Polarella glacialis]